MDHKIVFLSQSNQEPHMQRSRSTRRVRVLIFGSNSPLQQPMHTEDSMGTTPNRALLRWNASRGKQPGRLQRANTVSNRPITDHATRILLLCVEVLSLQTSAPPTAGCSRRAAVSHRK